MHIKFSFSTQVSMINSTDDDEFIDYKSAAKLKNFGQNP